MKLLRILLFAFPVCLFSCSKNSVTPAQEKPHIATIHAISYLNTSTDTAWIIADTVEKAFSTPVNEVDAPPFPEVFDSLYLDLDTVHQLSFKDPVLLPVIAMDNNTSLTLASDSIKIGAFELAKGFHSSKERWKSTYKYTGVINRCRMVRKYKRIYFHATVKVDVRDGKGQRYALQGQLEGSKAVSPSTSATIW